MLRIRVDDQFEAANRSISSGWQATTGSLSITALSNGLLTFHRVVCSTRIMFLVAATAVTDALQIILGKVEGVELR